jgi:hypothetical protein
MHAGCAVTRNGIRLGTDVGEPVRTDDETPAEGGS